MKCNRKEHKVTKRFKKVQLINAIRDRDLLTQHGLHLNSKGKEIMINRIEKIMNNVDSQTTNAIHLPWKIKSTIQSINVQSTPVTQIRNGTSSTKVIGNNPGTEDVKSKEAQNTNRHLWDNQELNKGLNKEETEREAGTSSKADQNPHIQLENRTGTSRTSKSQRNCPKPKNDDFFYGTD